jgi:hypothetical protein
MKKKAFISPQWRRYEQQPSRFLVRQQILKEGCYVDKLLPAHAVLQPLPRPMYSISHILLTRMNIVPCEIRLQRITTRKSSLPRI